MKVFLCLLLILSAAILTGCNRSAAKMSEAQLPPAAVFKAGHGLQFSPTAARLIELNTGEVKSRDVGGVKNVPAIPADALLRTIKGDFVYVANGEWFLRTPVTIGSKGDGHYEIKEGLYEGDVVVLKGARALWVAELQAINGGVGCADGH